MSKKIIFSIIAISAIQVGFSQKKDENIGSEVVNIVNSKNEKFTLGGFFIINEEKLKHLSKKKKDDICAKNAYALITAHLISLSNIQKLGTIK